MFGRWLNLPRDGPDLLRALLPLVTSTSVGITGTGRLPRCTPGTAQVESSTCAIRPRDRRVVLLLDRQLALGLLFPELQQRSGGGQSG